MERPLAQRIAYVRKNLTPTEGARRQVIHLTLDEFAEAVGAPSRRSPMRWEKGGTPRDYAERIAALTPYPPAAFGAAGEEELVRESFHYRLQALAAALEQERDQRDREFAAVTARLAALEADLERAAPRSARPSSVEEPSD